jgi:alanine dehydrogenase
MGSLSYIDIVHTLLTSQPSNIQTLSLSNMTLTTLTNTLYCIIDTLQMVVNKNKQLSAGLIR